MLECISLVLKGDSDISRRFLERLVDVRAGLQVEKETQGAALTHRVLIIIT